jgi:hypothetical protein
MCVIFLKLCFSNKKKKIFTLSFFLKVPFLNCSKRFPEIRKSDLARFCESRTLLLKIFPRVYSEKVMDYHSFSKIRENQILFKDLAVGSQIFEKVIGSEYLKDLGNCLGTKINS